MVGVPASACACVLSDRPFAGGEQQDRIYGTVPVPLRPTSRAGALLTWSVVDDAPAAEAVGGLEGVTLRLHLKDWSPPVRPNSFGLSWPCFLGLATSIGFPIF